MIGPSMSNWKRYVLILLAPILVCASARAQTRDERRREEQEFREWQKSEELASRVYGRGAELEPGNPDLLSVIHAELRGRLKGTLQTPEEIALKVIASAQAIGHPNPKMKFRQFRTQTEQHPFCWEVLAASEDADQLFAEAYQALVSDNPNYLDCTLYSGKGGLVSSRCVLPAFTKEIPYNDIVTKKKWHLWKWKDRKTPRAECNQPIGESGQKRVFSPWCEEVYVKDKPSHYDQAVPLSTTPITLDLERVVTRYRDRTLERIQRMADDEISVTRKNMQDKIDKAREKLDKAQVFAPPREKKFAFLVDNSGSISSVRDAAIDSMKTTIQGLKDDQQFTIAFITNQQHYFNGGKVVPATAANKAAALQFLESMRSTETGGNEVFDQAMNHIMGINGKFEAFYFFGDGQWPGETMNNNLTYARTRQTPINVRAMGSPDHSFLRSVAELSGGKYNDKPFDANQMKMSADEVKQLEEEVAKEEREVRKKLKDLQDKRDADVTREREKLDEFVRKFRAVNGECPQVTSRSTWTPGRGMKAIPSPSPSTR